MGVSRSQVCQISSVQKNVNNSVAKQFVKAWAHISHFKCRTFCAVSSGQLFSPLCFVVSANQSTKQLQKFSQIIICSLVYIQETRCNFVRLNFCLSCLVDYMEAVIRCIQCSRGWTNITLFITNCISRSYILHARLNN